MRWSIVRVILLRELRDQLRDRRTILMIVVLPLVLYPALGMALVQLALGMGEKPTVAGIVGQANLPSARPNSAFVGPMPAVAWALVSPGMPAQTPIDGRILGPIALARFAAVSATDPPLLGSDHFLPFYFDSAREAQLLRLEFLEQASREKLEQRQVDAILFIPPGFEQELAQEHQATLQILTRENDERSRLTVKRLYGVLFRWKLLLKEARLARHALPREFDDPIVIRDADHEKPADALAAEGLLDLLVRIFPFLLVMWSLAGALYPAVDLCAGEKERGTMETLLISPASREEIVWGKFLTIWVASGSTAFLNLISMGITTSQFGGVLSQAKLSAAALVWCAILLVPLSAFFSAICLAIGAYARSSKEGQYYLMPLFLVTMPLIFLTFAPGVELNAFYSLVPVTGVALLMQRLMTTSLALVPWLYFIPVLTPMALYSWLALRWAIEQFKREEVLFREAERLEVGLWLRRLFREKEPLPSLGQALFCFTLLIGLRWLSFSFSRGNSLVVGTGIAYLAFVAAPPLFMALILTTRPRQGLALRWPAPAALFSAALLATVLLPPLAELTRFILRQFPILVDLLSERQPLVEELRSMGEQQPSTWWHHLLVFGILPAICEELAFRGFILSGLRQRLRPWHAILSSSLLFALYHMNVFQVVPAFILGVILGVLAVQSGSLLPGMAFHLLHNGLLIGIAVLPSMGYSDEAVPLQVLFHPAITALLMMCAALLLGSLAQQLRAPNVEPVEA